MTIVTFSTKVCPKIIENAFRFTSWPNQLNVPWQSKYELAQLTSIKKYFVIPVSLWDIHSAKLCHHITQTQIIKKS